VLNRSVTVPRENLDARRRIAYVAEDKQTYGFMTVRQMIAFTRDFYTDWRPDVERRLVETFDLPLDRKVKTLSKGTRTKLALLLALARRPELLILDEPTEGLDPASIEELLRLLVTAAADGTTVLFSSHQIADVERIADHVCILETGRLALDIPLDRVRQHYRRISLGFAAEPPQFPFAVSAGSLHIDGRQLTVTTTQDADAILAWARHVGAASIQSAPITLREVFLDTVSEPRP
jgi:ABC-2 type transport system ATP-binding protein